MLRISKGAVAAAFAAMTPLWANACQLQLAGPITQEPLTYSAFHAGGAKAALSFTLKNAGSTACDASFVLVRAGEPEARSADGSTLPYRLLSEGGSPIHTVAKAAVLGDNGTARITLGAKQTVTARATIFVAGGQVTGPGVYRDDLAVAIYGGVTGGALTKAADAPVSVTIAVNPYMRLAVAGGGRRTTLDFGGLTDGAKRSVQLLAYANQSFHLTVRSENAGSMKPAGALSKAEGQWSVPYSVAVNKGAPVVLSKSIAITINERATPKSGLVIPLDVVIGSTKGQRAGLYRDVIEVTIDAGI